MLNVLPDIILIIKVAKLEFSNWNTLASMYYTNQIYIKKLSNSYGKHWLS